MWIKICGIRRPEIAAQLNSFPINAIGLNFYARSKRVVTVENARRIVRQLPDQVVPVGLFVNHSISEILETTQNVGLHTIQLHGDESAQMVATLSGDHQLKVIRALRPHSETGGFEAVTEHLMQIQQLGGTVERVLIDAAVPGEYGGTGHRADWNEVKRWSESGGAFSIPVVLAGGLTSHNVAQAIVVSGCAGVDVASGIEDEQAETSIEKIAAFVSEARTKV